ncbi:acyl-CoA dehydrogenase [Hydrocarboniphaga sp.]|uniref:acyl-CoA dehydrogenase n=1 Tax=Hydrocarboniphaga sp. TaxID=2033016 RepID=UPI003D0CB512
MSLARTDEQRLLAENLRRFLAEENQFEHHRQRLNAIPPQRLALWPGLVDMGVIGAAFDEGSGGFAGDARSIAVVMFELGRALAIEPFLGSAIVAGRVLLHLTDAAEREQQVAAMIGGERISVLAHDAGFDPFAKPLLKAVRSGAGYSLKGRVRGVRHADVADDFLVSAQIDDGDVAIFRVARSAIDSASHRLMDGAGAADLAFDGFVCSDDARLKLSEPAMAVISDALEWGLFGLTAEAAGLIEAANEATFRYLGERKQFGVMIGSFQALQHRAADMYMAAQEVTAIVNLAIDALADGVSPRRSVLLSAAKVLADTAGRRVGHDAIQMHGGMGVSDELNVSHFGRRLATIRAEFGSADLHRQRFGCDQDLSDILALQDSDEARAWRDEVREFTRKHLPEAIGRKGALGLEINKEDYVGWQKVLYQHDWFAGAWPQEHGGQGWDLRKQLIFAQESTLNNAPMIRPYGVSMVGPVIYSYGSDAQKRDHLPGILSNDVWWCQGYSEPGAGSDLAAIKTTAELDGDHYVVNGAKMWTTEAHWADWMHCLVRTDKSGKPQSGITFLLIDMKTPGIEIKPIVTIDGLHHTNALFLDNVRVPVGNRVGAEGQGWGIAKFLLGNERISIADTGPKLRLLRHVKALHARAMASADVPDALKTLMSTRLADLSIQLMTLCALERQYIEAWADGAKFGAEASILKVRGTEILQAITELGLELEGPLAAAFDPEDLHRSPFEHFDEIRQASLMGLEYLYGRCWSIFGGTNEIQRNIIAKQVLGI